jgi:hypothetical protein
MYNVTSYISSQMIFDFFTYNDDDEFVYFECEELETRIINY